MNSCIYECTVMHRRLKPKVHQFTYRVFMFWLDLDELAEIQKRIPIFSSESPNLYSLRSQDHFSVGGASICENVIAWARAQGESREVGSVRMLTLPRFLGYTFNPITIYVLYDSEGRAITSVTEVGNTFRELKPYLVPMDGSAFHSRVTKNFYVSPFSDLDLAFDFRYEEPTDRLRVWIDDYRGDEKELISVLTGSRRALTTAGLLACTVKYPFITLKVIGLIHWEAFRLWLKRIPFHLKEANTHLQQKVFNPHASLKRANSDKPDRS
jgi:DUF1365 family protein